MLLPRGRHAYAIIYRTARQLGFFEDHDELYWNVNGNGWTFAIDRAARTSPAGAGAGEALRREAYTGAQGARGRDYAVAPARRRRAPSTPRGGWRRARA